MHRGEENCISRVVEGKLKERDHLEDPSLDKNTTFKCILKKYVGRGWILWVWDRKKWWTHVNMVTDLRIL